ncbi:MAG: 16S rRNA (uracil(1498)-N(3))-methyltransferase [Pseudomonadota bacterium]
MPDYDFRTHRLFVDQTLDVGTVVEPDRAQSNYLLNVLRLRDGAPILLFNGRDGEWVAEVSVQGRKACNLMVDRQTRPQTPVPALSLMFAPLKQARLEYMVQKAVEMGAGTLQPVLTQRTQMRKLNMEKMRAYTVEACEQCGVINLPNLLEPQILEEAMAAQSAETHVIFCDEGAPVVNPADALSALPSHAVCSVLIGPEGGFTQQERAMLMDHPRSTRIALGPRILRADTAAVAALAAVQMAIGDWS